MAETLQQEGLITLTSRRYLKCVNRPDEDYIHVTDLHCPGKVVLNGGPYYCPDCGRPIEYPSAGKEVFEELRVDLDYQGVESYISELLSELDIVRSQTWISDGVMRVTLTDDRSLIIVLADYAGSNRMATGQDAAEKIIYITVSPIHNPLPHDMATAYQLELADILIRGQDWLIEQIDKVTRLPRPQPLREETPLEQRLLGKETAAEENQPRSPASVAARDALQSKVSDNEITQMTDKDETGFVVLRNVLANLYSDEASARRVVSDVGLEGRRISFSGHATNTWHAILKEAENTDKIEKLITVALGDYGTNSDLLSACETYQGRIQSKSKKSTEPAPQGAVSSREAPITILFLAANPTDTTRLRLGEESRSIDQALRQTEYRDRFELEQAHAVRVADLQGLLLRYQPHIVHFSGHGSATSETTSSKARRHVGTIPISGHGGDGGAIILEDDAGKSHPVSPRALSTVFALLKDNIRCVVLNACYSAPQAQAIAEHIGCVIGMSDAIGDRAAISFATAFYQALGYGRDVKTAFELGRAQIDLEGIPEEKTPQLLATKVDPAEVVLVSSA